MIFVCGSKFHIRHSTWLLMSCFVNVAIPLWMFDRQRPLPNLNSTIVWQALSLHWMHLTLSASYLMQFVNMHMSSQQHHKLHVMRTGGAWTHCVCWLKSHVIVPSAILRCVVQKFIFDDDDHDNDDDCIFIVTTILLRFLMNWYQLHWNHFVRTTLIKILVTSTDDGCWFA